MSRLGLLFSRIAAAFIDALLIIGWAACLAVMSLSLSLNLEGWPRLWVYGFALLTLTLPVVLAFTIMERVWGVTPGKRLLRLEIVSADSGSVSLGQAFFRNVLKYLPWELAHIGIWLTPGQPFVSPPGLASSVFWGISYALLGLQLILVAVTGRGLHDRLSGSRVVRRLA